MQGIKINGVPVWEHELFGAVRRVLSGPSQSISDLVEWEFRRSIGMLVAGSIPATSTNDKAADQRASDRRLSLCVPT